MNPLEYDPSRMYECAECGSLIVNEPVYRLNPDEVVCLRDYAEVCAFLWQAGVYDQQVTT